MSAVDSALQADQAEMATIANDVANINTPGYARESVSLSPYPATGPEGQGGGVEVTGIAELSSEMLDTAARSATAAQQWAGETSSVMSNVESLFPEPSAAGLASQLSGLWSDLSALAANPSDPSLGSVVLSDLQTVTGTIRDTYSSLQSQGSELASQLGSGSGSGDLAQANALLAEVASLNLAIVNGKSAGTDVNALVDQRRADLSQLAGLTGITARLERGGSMTVLSGGVALVEDGVAATLQATGDPGAGTLSVQTSSGVALALSGSIGAKLQAVNKTIPAYEAELSSVANALAGGLNSVQASSYSTSGQPGSSLPAVLVSGTAASFTASAASAADVVLNPALTPALLATASSASTPLDGLGAAAMAAIGASSGGPDAAYRQLVAGLGAATAAAGQAATATKALADEARGAASSVSGVDSNSELMAMLQAQQAFQAAARLASTISSSMQSLLQAV